MPGPSLKSWCACALALLALAGLGAAQPANARMQSALHAAMAGRNGTAVVLDVASGRVLASHRLDIAAQRVVAPGSTLKPFTLQALLEADKVDANTTLMCKRPLTVAGHKLDCPHPETHQPLDPVAALAYSCNSYFTSVATRLSPADFRNFLVRRGFAQPTGMARDEAAGMVALASSPEELQLQAIGAWGIETTPLELLGAYRDLAQLSRSNRNARLALVFSGLEASTAYGMGRLAQPVMGMRVAGKTGTSVAGEGPWTHAWFAGWAPAGDPQIVVVVFLEKGHGGTDAAGVARAIFAAYADRRGATPSATHGAQP